MHFTLPPIYKILAYLCVIGYRNLSCITLMSIHFDGEYLKAFYHVTCEWRLMDISRSARIGV